MHLRDLYLERTLFSAVAANSQFSGSFSIHVVCANTEGAYCEVCGFDFFSWSGYETGSGYFRVCLVIIDFLCRISSKEAVLTAGLLHNCTLYLITDLHQQSCLNVTLLLVTTGCT